jgi:parvulin-like peptidyl-prolyl isomerase
MVREFDQVVFAMQPGQYSNIVESPFGFHIIKLEKIKGAERQARHILIIPTTTQEDADRTKAVAEEIAAKIKAGASVDSLAKAVGDPNEQSHIGPFARANLPEPYKTQLATAVAGAVLGPMELPGATGIPKFAIVKVTETKPAGEYSLDDPDFRNDIKQTLAQNTLVDELISDLSKRTLVEYRLQP